MNSPDVTRWIRGYEKIGGSMRVEYRLPESLSLQQLQYLFGVPEDNPMYDCFPITASIARVLELTIGSPLLDETQEFFLEADAG